MTTDDRLLRWVRAGALVLVLAGVVARFDGLGARVFWHDETHTGCAIAGSGMHEIVKDVFDGRAHGRDEFLVHQFPREDRTVIDTLRVLAKDDPRQVPLYFVLARAWVITFGSSIEILRSFSAVLGVISLPLVFLLSRELFGRRLEAWIAVGLLAISPIHWTYAQEARQYLLWVDLVILSSWLLLLALRRSREGRRAFWWFVLYGFTIGFTLFTHLLTVLVIAAHLSFVAVFHRRLPVVAVWMVAVSHLVVAACFWPWARYIVEEAKHRPWISWATVDVGLPGWIRRAGGAYAKTFFDSGEGILHNIAHLQAGLALLVALVCFVLLLLYAPLRARLFLLLLGSICSMPMIAKDLWSGGVRTLVTRYQFPAILALELGVAFGIAFLLRTERRGLRWLGAGAALMLAVCGLTSIFRPGLAATSSGQDTLAVIRYVEQWPAPLVVTGRNTRGDLGMALSFAHTSGPGTRMLVVAKGALPDVPETAEPVFLWRSPPELRRRLEERGWGLQRTPAPELHRLVRGR